MAKKAPLLKVKATSAKGAGKGTGKGAAKGVSKALTGKALTGKVSAGKAVAKKLVAKAPVASRPAKRKAGKALPPAPLAAVLTELPDAARPDPSPMVDATVLDRLAATVLSRRTADPALSHSARLMARGTAKVAQKFGEEAVECLIEAVAGDHDALVAESADVLYHLIVLWVNAGVAPLSVWQELDRREGISGIAEKARRKIALPTTKIP